MCILLVQLLMRYWQKTLYICGVVSIIADIINNILTKKIM